MGPNGNVLPTILKWIYSRKGRRMGSGSLSSQSAVVAYFRLDAGECDRADFHLQVDDTANFSSPVVDVLNLTPLTYIPDSPLPAARYNWRVRAINAQGIAGAWSTTGVVILDITAPAALVVVTPTDRAVTTAVRPTFTWNITATATTYRLYLSDGATCDHLIRRWIVCLSRVSPLYRTFLARTKPSR